MSFLDKIFGQDNSKISQEIAFTGDEKTTDIFNASLDVKLEEYRQRMKDCVEKMDNPENELGFLDSKYKLHIGNAIRFKEAAKYGEIFDSLEAQDGQVNMELFDNAWGVMKVYASKGINELDNKPDFNEDTENHKVARLQISSSLGVLIWREVYKDESTSDWRKTDVPVITESGESTNDDGYEKLLAHLSSKYGKYKKIESF
jgi:hypothetical protein